MKVKFTTLSILGVLLIFTLNCTSVKFVYFNDDKKLAEKVVENFHQFYNDEKYTEIYDNAHPDAKATKSKDKLVELLTEMRKKSGRFQNSKLIDSKVSTINVKERQVELIYKSKFENEEVNERFLIVTNDDSGNFHSYGQASDEELKNLK